MKLDNEFTVGVPIGEAWGVLTDLEMIAPCMPGAQLTGVNDGVYTGKVRIKVGPVTAEYSGTARFSEKDEAAYRAVIDARGRDSRGNGNAAAVISAQLFAEGESTRVTVTTDLTIAGRIAQFGSGMIKEVSAKLLGQFVQCLEGRLGGDRGNADGVWTAPAAAPSTASTATTASPGQATTSAPLANSVTAAAAGPGTAAAPSTAAAASTVSAGNGAAGNGAASTVSAGTVSASTVSAGTGTTSAPEPAALDLLSVAGRAIYKRLIPVVAGLVVLAVVIWLIVR